MSNNVAQDIFDEILDHLTTNEVSVRIDDRPVLIVPYNPTTTYKQQYPAILLDTLRITSYTPTMTEGGLHDFEMAFLVIDKMNQKQQSETEAQNRVNDLSYRLARVLQTLEIGKPYSASFDFEALETVANNEAMGQVTLNLNSVLITDCSN